jgi:hypothetical protein
MHEPVGDQAHSLADHNFRLCLLNNLAQVA